MTKKEVEDYLEKRLHSHERDTMEDMNRLVWIRDVINVVYELMENNSESKYCVDNKPHKYPDEWGGDDSPKCEVCGKLGVVSVKYYDVETKAEYIVN